MSEKPSQIERDTDLETAMWEPCERYCQDILKRGEITDREHTLIVGNIRGFYSWLKLVGRSNDAHACLLEIHKLMADWSVPVRIKPDEQYTVKRVKELLIHYQRKELGYK